MVQSTKGRHPYLDQGHLAVYRSFSGAIKLQKKNGEYSKRLIKNYNKNIDKYYINDPTTLTDSLSSRLHFQADVDATEETATHIMQVENTI